MVTETTRFRFNGLADGEHFAELARDAAGLEISPVWRVGAEIEITSTGEAEGWSVYLRQVSGEALVLHDARTMIGAARALVAADRIGGFPATLEAWDMRCEAESVRNLPDMLRRILRCSTVVCSPDAHAGFALAAWIDLVRHQAARRDLAQALPGPGR